MDEDQSNFNAIPIKDQRNLDKFRFSIQKRKKKYKNHRIELQTLNNQYSFKRSHTQDYSIELQNFLKGYHKNQHHQHCFSQFNQNDQQQPASRKKIEQQNLNYKLEHKNAISERITKINSSKDKHNTQENLMSSSQELVKTKKKKLPKLSIKNCVSLTRNIKIKSLKKQDKQIIKDYMNIYYQYPSKISNQKNKSKKIFFEPSNKKIPLEVMNKSVIAQDNFQDASQTNMSLDGLDVQSIKIGQTKPQKNNYNDDKLTIKHISRIQQVSTVKTNTGSRKIIKQNILDPLNNYKNNNNIKHKNSQWKQFNPLKLQTYFVKLNKIQQQLNLQPNSTILKSQPNHKIKMYPLPLKNNIKQFIKNYTPYQIKMDQLFTSQFFSVQYIQNQQLYFGDVFNNGKTKIKNGDGVLIKDEYLYQGKWKNNLKISGVQINNHGKYTGEFKADKKHGTGQFQWFNGEYYSGQWKQGFKHGSGFWRSAKGDNYIGEWLNGKVTGYGVHKTATGQIYQGQFKQFLKNGKGKQTFSNGDKYQGSYKNGYPHGNGKYTWKNGYSYEGNFESGFRTGKGQLYSLEGLIYNGQFFKESVSGYGEYQIGNGDVYQGMMKNGVKHGKGVLNKRSSKVVYDGQWINGKFSTITQTSEKMQEQQYQQI